MLDHLSISVADLTRAMFFYDRVLAPLGYTRLETYDDVAAGYGRPGDSRAPFWITVEDEGPMGRMGRWRGFQIAFSAPDRAAVDAFHAAALAAGAEDHGQPGDRPAMAPAYYCAFVIAPDGYRLDAICHDGAPPAGAA